MPLAPLFLLALLLVNPSSAQLTYLTSWLTGGGASGGTGTSAGYSDGPPVSALFSSPGGLAWVPWTATQLLLADSGNSAIRSITYVSGTIFSIGLGAGGGGSPPNASSHGFSDGIANAAAFWTPASVRVSNVAGSNPPVFIADAGNNAVRVMITVSQAYASPYP